MKNKYHTGCSGYYYPSWKNEFYPTSLQPKEWLKYYAGKFNTVELNGTFYRTPTLSTLTKYTEQTPEDVIFSIKVISYITHILRLKDCAQAITDFQGLMREGLGKNLSG